jgi:hypothetical protein
LEAGSGWLESLREELSSVVEDIMMVHAQLKLLSSGLSQVLRLQEERNGMQKQPRKEWPMTESQTWYLPGRNKATGN